MQHTMALKPTFSGALTIEVKITPAEKQTEEILQIYIKAGSIKFQSYYRT